VFYANSRVKLACCEFGKIKLLIDAKVMLMKIWEIELKDESGGGRILWKFLDKLVNCVRCLALTIYGFRLKLWFHGINYSYEIDYWNQTIIMPNQAKLSWNNEIIELCVLNGWN